MGYLERLSEEIASVLIREGLSYNQSKSVFKLAREKAGLRPPKKKQGAVNRLLLEEELRFIDHAYEMSGRTGLMMQTLLETGTRVSEFVQIRIEDISFSERILIIEEGKGGKRREIPLRRELTKLLQMHLGQRQAGFLFRSRERGAGGTPFSYSRQRIGQIVRQVARKAGIRKRIYPHLLRHTIATRLLNQGMTITEVQRFLGHEDISTTQIYAVTSAASLRKRFDQVTDENARALIDQIKHVQGDTAAAFAIDLLRDRVNIQPTA